MNSSVTEPARQSAGTGGEICWIDLGTPHVDRSAAFYSEMFGWTVQEPDSGGYRLAGLNDKLVAALGPAEDPGPPYWSVYIHTPDIDAAVTAAVQAGATLLVPPTPAGEAGIAAVLRDPASGPLSLWQPLAHAETPQPGEYGTLAAAELHSSLADLHANFLTEVFAWKRAERASSATPDQYPSPWIVRFRVADVPNARRQAIELGATVAPNVPGALIDPNGALFGLSAD